MNNLQRNLIPLIILSLSLFSKGLSQTSYYISQEAGSDQFNGKTIDKAFQSFDRAFNGSMHSVKAGDTLFLVGIFSNPSFNDSYSFNGNIYDPHIWRQENTIKLSNIHGTKNAYITLKSFNEHTIIKGDGANLFRMTDCSYVRIKDLHLYGQVESIPIETAMALQFLYKESSNGPVFYRVQPGTSDEEVENLELPILETAIRPSYTDTRGIYLSNVHHIDLINNIIHHVPGNGFRVSYCDYINIIGNEVHNTSRKSYSGTHGLVVTKATSFDNNDEVKIIISGNKVHHNYNEIYSWAPMKDFITPRIDEGKGISLQRNSSGNGWINGRILVSNNICFWNGFSGIHSNSGTRIDFINNTCYMNSYTSSITYKDNPGGNNIGISTSSGDDIRIINNLVGIDGQIGGFPISTRDTESLVVSDNMVYAVAGSINHDPDLSEIGVNTVVKNPIFSNENIYDFSLMAQSPAIDIANTIFAPSMDYNGKPRDDQPDLGALEYYSSVKNQNMYTTEDALICYPNPVSDCLNIKVKDLNGPISIYNIYGDRLYFKNSLNRRNDLISIDVSTLAAGWYIVFLANSSKTFIKN